MAECVLSVQNLVKGYGPRMVLNGMSLEIRQKEVLVIIGPSGGGKSTLLRCINGLEEFTSGRIVVDGMEVNPRKAGIWDVRKRVGMIFQHFNLFPHLTARQNIELAPRKPRNHLMVLNLSGRGDKDLASVADYLERRSH